MSIIGTVANHLQLIETKGFAVIRDIEDWEANEILDYTVNLLHGIKADYSFLEFDGGYLVLMDDGRDNIYEELDAAVKALDGNAIFVADGTVVFDPYLDETGRYDIDPLSYYGVKLIMEAIGR